MLKLDKISACVSRVSRDLKSIYDALGRQYQVLECSAESNFNNDVEKHDRLFSIDSLPVHGHVVFHKVITSFTMGLIGNESCFCAWKKVSIGVEMRMRRVPTVWLYYKEQLINLSHGRFSFHHSSCNAFDRQYTNIGKETLIKSD